MVGMCGHLSLVALILGQTGEHCAGGILDRTSIPLVQYRPTRRTDLPGAGLVQSRSSLTRTTVGNTLGNTGAWAIALLAGSATASTLECW